MHSIFHYSVQITLVRLHCILKFIITLVRYVTFVNMAVAAVTPQMLLNSKTNTGPLQTCQSLETVSADQIKAKLPGQG